MSFLYLCSVQMCAKLRLDLRALSAVGTASSGSGHTEWQQTNTEVLRTGAGEGTGCLKVVAVADGLKTELLEALQELSMLVNICFCMRILIVNSATYPRLSQSCNQNSRLRARLHKWPVEVVAVVGNVHVRAQLAAVLEEAPQQRLLICLQCAQQ